MKYIQPYARYLLEWYKANPPNKADDDLEDQYEVMRACTWSIWVMGR